MIGLFFLLMSSQYSLARTFTFRWSMPSWQMSACWIQKHWDNTAALSKRIWCYNVMTRWPKIRIHNKKSSEISLLLHSAAQNCIRTMVDGKPFHKRVFYLFYMHKSLPSDFCRIGSNLKCQIQKVYISRQHDQIEQIGSKCKTQIYNRMISTLRKNMSAHCMQG